MKSRRSYKQVLILTNDNGNSDPAKLKYLEKSSSYNKNKSNISSISRGIKVYQEDFDYDIKESKFMHIKTEN